MNAIPLVCLPFAGAGASFYYPWIESAREEIQVMAVQPPGREWRFTEEPYRDVTEAADGLLPEIAAELGGEDESGPVILCGDCPVFEAGWRLDMRRKVADDPADVTVFLDDALTVAAPAQMAVELGSLGLGQVAEYEVEGLGMGQLDVPLRSHRRLLAG